MDDLYKDIEGRLEDFTDGNPELVGVIGKIKDCYDFRSLYSMSEDLHKVGLTIHPTISRKMVLCKIVEGKAKADVLNEDYIFIGEEDRAGEQLPHRLIEYIIPFVRTSSGEPEEIVRDKRSWGDIHGGGGLEIADEDTNRIAQDLDCGGEYSAGAESYPADGITQIARYI